MEKPKEHHLVKRGDLIFRSRGLTSTSAILLDDPGSAVVAAPLLRIRVIDGNTLPEYLNWYFVQLPAQAFLTSRAGGATQRMISKESLEGMQIFLPSPERQKKIVEIAALAETERDLLRRIADRRHQSISAALMHLAQGV